MRRVWLNQIQIILFCIINGIFVTSTPGCVQRSYEKPENIVCVCNSTYCDSIEPLGQILEGNAAVYRSNIAGARMDKETIPFVSNKGEYVITFDALHLHQEILGFGGAFTDAAGINVLSLPQGAQELLLQQYYGSSGAEYTLGRVPMASTDFSTRPYSYADAADDFNLETFALAEDDEKYKIPLIKHAMSLQSSTGGLRLFSSPWSAPAWMKSNNAMKGGGRLRGFEGGPYYVTWANYFVRFLEEYAKHGISFWATTVQNEPTSGSDPNYAWQTMYFNAQGERNFIKGQLGPALRNSSVGHDVHIICMDDQRFMLPSWADIVFGDPEASQYVPGLAVHWYEDSIYPASALSRVHENHPDKFILATEACNGWFMADRGVRVGDYGRAENYAHSIMEDLNNYVGGWMDWNIALDMTGGPTWVANNVDSPILVDADRGEFIKQPMYYAMAHFSKFMKPGSRRASLIIPADLPVPVEALGVLLVDGHKVVVLMNRDNEKNITISIEDKQKPGKYVQVNLAARTILSIIWNE